MGYERKKWNWGESNPRPVMQLRALSTCLGAIGFGNKPARPRPTLFLIQLYNEPLR